MKLKQSLRRTNLFEFTKSIKDYYSRIDDNKINIIVITGSASGLGRLLTHYFSEEGYRIIGIDIKDRETLDEKTRQSLTDYYVLDLFNLHTIAPMIREIEKKHSRIDVLINNAGILDFKLLDQYSVEEINRIITVNLTSCIVLIKHVIPVMQKNKFGRIVNISSISAFQAEDKFEIYSPTKAGMMMMSDSIAKWTHNKLDGNITSNSFNPDRINTPEYIGQNPNIDLKNVISSRAIFKKIKRVITSNVNGSTYVFTGFTKRMKFFMNFYRKFFGH